MVRQKPAQAYFIGIQITCENGQKNTFATWVAIPQE